MTRSARAAVATLGAWVAVGCGAATPEVVGPPAAWVQTWGDEFDGPARALPDRTRWTFDVGGGGWGNRQLEYDTDSPDNVSLDGEGHLVITARRESLGANGFTSGRIKTQGLFAQRYGRIEARVRLPSGRGVWPAFWMLGADFPTKGWPGCGEIDVLEMRGQEPSVVLGSLHGPGYSGGGALSARYRLTEGRFDAGFHRFAVEWDPNRIRFLVDDEPFQVVPAASVLARGDWVFDHEFFLLLNVAVGGDFVGPPDAATPFPQSMTVDWVRVFRRAP
jgi:beta-glucanase (GH16 family)